MTSTTPLGALLSAPLGCWARIVVLLLALSISSVAHSQVGTPPATVQLDPPPGAVVPARADRIGFVAPASPATAPSSPSGAQRAPLYADHRRPSAATHTEAARLPKRDPLVADLDLAIKATPEHAVDLPGVLKLDGAVVGVLDPARSRQISWTNQGSQTVYLSAADPNRIQLPFPNPRVVSTTDVEIDKRANSSNVYITFAPGVTHAVQVWLEPQEGSGAAVGLQLVPARIPAQSVQIVDDSGALNPQPARAEDPDDFFAHAEGELHDALEGGVPQGWATVDLPVPPIALDGVLVEGARRLSSRAEDIYVYTVVNPGLVDVTLEETQFDGPRVEAVSILPAPLIKPKAHTQVAVLVRKSDVPRVPQAPALTEGR